MDTNFLEFRLPIWWIFPAVFFAFVIAFILYKKTGVPWSKNQNLFLGGIRLLAIFLILLLVLNPFLRQVINEVKRPLVVIGLDNSSSIAFVHDNDSRKNILGSLTEIQNLLTSEKDYRVEFVPFLGDGDSVSFDGKSSDLSAFLRSIEDEYANSNLGGVVLATDGIFNRGASPAYKSFNYPLFTLGLGDTIPQRDIVISEVRNNAVAYSGNEFPVRVKVISQGYDSQRFELQILEKKKIRASTTGTLVRGINEFTFFLNAETPGLKHYSVLASEFTGEVTFANNRREVFIEVLESKKQVLIAADSPHPDIRAIRSILEETGNYEVTVFIDRISERPNGKKFDVQILIGGSNPYPELHVGTWTINSDAFGSNLSSIPFLKVEAKGQPDQVRPSYNSNFSKFKLTQELDRLDEYPPISVPFGDYTFSGPYEILFYQKIGGVVTDKPVIAVFDNGDQRQAVTAGQGIWQWRLQEAANNSDPQLFQELVQKLVQYLSINESKKQFRVTKGLEIFTDGEVVYFDVEIYDDIFQMLEGQPYELEIQDENVVVSRFDFVFGLENRIARITSFPSGTYTYVARTQVGEKNLVDRGEFVVNALQLEQLKLTANHPLLEQIASKSGGSHYHLAQVDSLKELLLSTNFKGIIRSDSDRFPLINSFLAMLLIAGLLMLEWGLRKFWGGY